MSTRGKVFLAPSVGGPLGAPEPDADIAAGERMSQERRESEGRKTTGNTAKR